VEHVERQEEREQELRDDANQLEQEGDRMEGRSDDLGKKVENVREEFRRRQQSEDVPGAQEPDELSDEASPPPPEADIAPGDRDD
jgi:hypothetical protein